MLVVGDRASQALRRWVASTDQAAVIGMGDEPAGFQNLFETMRCPKALPANISSTALIGLINNTSAVSSSCASGAMKLSVKGAVAAAVFSITRSEIDVTR